MKDREYEFKISQLTAETERLTRQNEELHRQKAWQRDMEFQQDMQHSKRKAEHEHKVQKRKTLLDLIKSVPGMVLTALAAIAGIIKLAF
jgi:hypothetical protein